MRLRPSHLFEQDAAEFTFQLCAVGVVEPRRIFAITAKRCGGARSVLMRVSAAGRTIVVTGLLAALTLSAQACAKHQPPEPAATAAAKAQQPSAAKAPPTAQPMPPDPRVGAVFLGGGDLHTCTGGVLDSAAGDLILTAAHCVAEGVDATFVAGLHDTAAPEDFWRIDAVYLDPRWVQNQDPMADFAIARVSRDAGGSVEELAGGGLKLGRAPKPGTVVTVTGYGMGVGGSPIGCQTATAPPNKGFPAFDCAALVDGLSGAPWMDGSTVAGVIGGLNGGGCADESISYSPPFDDAIKRLLARAEAGGPGDAAPTVFDDECD
jgi:hypothetical protein